MITRSFVTALMTLYQGLFCYLGKNGRYLYHSDHIKILIWLSPMLLIVLPLTKRLPYPKIQIQLTMQPY